MHVLTYCNTDFDIHCEEMLVVSSDKAENYKDIVSFGYQSEMEDYKRNEDVTGDWQREWEKFKVLLDPVKISKEEFLQKYNFCIRRLSKYMKLDLSNFIDAYLLLDEWNLCILTFQLGDEYHCFSWSTSA